METNENMQISTDLKALSKNYLLLREAQWKNSSSSETDILKQNYQKELKLSLEKYGNNPFTSEEGCLFAKFVSLFEKDVFDSESDEYFEKNIKINSKKYPILSVVEQEILKIKQHTYDFFVSSGQKFSSGNESFSIIKTGNMMADTIIETEVNRMILDQNTREGGKGKNGTYSISINSSDSSFDLSLAK